MATLAERYPDNAAGDFYVDRTCIDCDACRRIAPAVFAEAAASNALAGTSSWTRRRRSRRHPDPRPHARHAVLLYRDRFLFTGDHVTWSTRRGGLIAFRDACWYSWEEQTRSMERLLDFSFEWVLPGHGAWHRAESAAAIERCCRSECSTLLRANLPSAPTATD
jgi:ferredoxin